MPFILVGDRGPEPYIPPIRERGLHVDSSGDIGGEGGGGAPPYERHARHAYEEAAKPEPARRPAMLAEQIMTAPPVTLAPDDPLQRIWDIVRQKRIMHIPVVGPDGRVLGIVSDRDLMLRKGERAGQLMSKKVIVATRETPIREIARVLVDEGIGCVPIVDAQHGVVGMVTRTDVLRCVVNEGPLDLWT